MKAERIKARRIFSNIIIFLGVLLVALGFYFIIGTEKTDAESAEYVQSAITAIETDDKSADEIIVNNQEYIGILEIPSLDIKLPVSSVWSETAADKGVCRFDGSIDENNLIIAGHNYRNLLKNLLKIETGSEAIFTDTAGNEYHYIATYTEILSPTDTEKMTNGEWDMTVFTCTIGGSSRFAVRFEIKK